MLDGITPAHLLLILVIALLVLGPGKLPEVGEALGKSIREFRSAMSDTQASATLIAASTQAAAPSSTPIVPPVTTPTSKSAEDTTPPSTT